MMRTSRLVALIACALLLLPIEAHALSGMTALGFCSTYVAPDGSTCTHRGIDVLVDAGSAVEAPVGGTVSFAGRVPGPHGGSVLAVSVETALGVMTALPFTDLSVESGQEIQAGTLLGGVADTGDPSTAKSHLHLGLKRGGVYVDPGELLALAGEQAQPPVSPAPAPAPAPAGQPSVPAAVPAPAPSPLVNPRPSAAAQTAPKATPDGLAAARPSAAIAADPGEAVREPVGGTELAPGVSIAPGVSDSLPVRSGAAAPRTGGAALGGSATEAARSAVLAGAVPGRTAAAFGGLAAVAFVSVVLLTRRSLARRVAGQGPVSDRLGNLLQHLKAGDTLCGLTSCSGPSAFTVPGPLAQRR